MKEGERTKGSRQGIEEWKTERMLLQIMILREIHLVNVSLLLTKVFFHEDIARGLLDKPYYSIGYFVIANRFF